MEIGDLRFIVIHTRASFRARFPVYTLVVATENDYPQADL